MNRAVPYLRVSTDDKGQDPARQLDVITPWAAHEGVELLDAALDEGTSATKTNPFDRPMFVSACERGRAVGAAAIVVECPDRFTRQGTHEHGWAVVELRRRYGLALFIADKPLAQHETMVGDVTDALHAEVAREWARGHSEKVRSGMARAKSEGRPVGRPKKVLTDDELALARSLHEGGDGFRKIAYAVSRARGAFDVADPARRSELSVSHTFIRDLLDASAKVPRR